MKIEHQQARVGRYELHVVTSGDPGAQPYVFLHGWPESWCHWHDVMAVATDARCVAIDLPGIGGSRGAVESGRKLELAQVVDELVTQMHLENVTIVGHDVGGMIAYAYLRVASAKRVVIVSTVIPGLDPWEQAISNPADWHWAFHATPHLPELLVKGHELAYFGFFYDFLSADPRAITPERRAQYAAAYADDESLRAGFALYRAMAEDAKDNASQTSACSTPVLYVGGGAEGAGPELARYADGLRRAGVHDLETAVIAKSGHFIADEQPAALWDAIARAGSHRHAA